MRPIAANRISLFIAGALAGLSAVLASQGCAPSSSIKNSPSVAQIDYVSQRRLADPTVVVLGRFENPSFSPLRSRDIGSGMRDALSQIMLKDRQFDVWVSADERPRYNGVFQRPVAEPTSNGSQDIDSEEEKPTNPVSYIITGRVTDFQHTFDLPDALRESGRFSRRNQAIVAIELKVVDARTGRIIATDHVSGSARAGHADAKDQYRNVAFGSYVFWNTPLGLAAKEAVDLAAHRLRVLVPEDHVQPRVVRVMSERKVGISAGRDAGLIRGERFYLGAVQRTGEIVPLIDPDTRLPLSVRIDDVDQASATAWLVGRPPLEHSIRGAMLLTELPKRATRPTRPTLSDPVVGDDAKAVEIDEPLANVTDVIAE